MKEPKYKIGQSAFVIFDFKIREVRIEGVFLTTEELREDETYMYRCELTRSGYDKIDVHEMDVHLNRESAIASL